MREETHDSEMTSGDKTMIHSSRQAPGPLDTSRIERVALGRLTRGGSKTPTLIFVSREEFKQFAGHLGGVLGRFSLRMAKNQNCMYLDIGCLWIQGQQQARELGKLQRRLEQGESLLVEELDIFQRTIGMLDQEYKSIQAEIVARVQAEFQTQQACQAEQAEHCQPQDEQV